MQEVKAVTFTCKCWHKTPRCSRYNSYKGFSNIAKAIFRSDKGNLIQNLADIPCDVIQSLESDADEAEEFVNQLQAGEIPSIISDFPSAAVSEFADTIEVATAVIADVAGAAITDVIDVFNEIGNGSILDDVVSDVEAIPTDLVDAITNGWGDFTDEVKTGWSDFTCWIEDDCTTLSTADACSLPASAAATTTPGAAATTTSPDAAATTSLGAAATTTPSAAAATTTFYAAAATTTPDATTIAASSTSQQDSLTFEPPSTAPATETAIPPQQTTFPQTSVSTTPANPVQNTAQPAQASPPVQFSEGKSLALDWAKSNLLALAAIGVFGLALWL